MFLIISCLINFQLNSFPLEGKDAACDVNAVPILSQLLADESSTVKANAAGALMAYVKLILLLFLRDINDQSVSYC